MRALKTLTCLAILAGSLAIAIPAGAHTFAVTGTAVCSDGSHHVTWSITNGLPKKAMSITATSAASGVAYDVSVATNPVPGGATTEATTVVPGGVTGDIVLTVNATWPDEFMRTLTATVALPDACSTTATTAPPATTTPTTQPHGVAGVTTSVPSTTAPTGVAGVECGGPGQLACTGSDSGREVVAGFGLLIVGAGLIALRRRPARKSLHH